MGRLLIAAAIVAAALIVAAAHVTCHTCDAVQEPTTCGGGGREFTSCTTYYEGGEWHNTDCYVVARICQ